MGLVVGFDLDDTLYRELDFVESGFRAVARYASKTFDVEYRLALSVLHASFQQHGRGRQFDDLLYAIGKFTRTRRDHLISIYRHHEPEIKLPAESDQALRLVAAGGHRQFLVTDGHKIVQASKVSALGLSSRFEHAYLTSRYGRSAAKPSTKVFKLILRRTGANPDALIYVGDDPHKDFVGVRALGGKTIRVLTGRHRHVTARRGYDADVTVGSITAAAECIREIASRTSSGQDSTGAAGSRD